MPICRIPVIVTVRRAAGQPLPVPRPEPLTCVLRAGSAREHICKPGASAGA
jgi:hypothetical protein